MGDNKVIRVYAPNLIIDDPFNIVWVCPKCVKIIKPKIICGDEPNKFICPICNNQDIIYIHREDKEEYTITDFIEGMTETIQEYWEFYENA